jgi:hypothetical protein
MELSSAQLSVLSALQNSTDRWGESRISMDEMKEVTGYGRTSLSKSVAVLAANGYIEVTRTKRNWGKLYRNVYRVLERTSTADYIDLTTNSNTIKTTKVLNTSYLIGADALEGEKEMNKWSDDDNVGGFGLLDDEIQVGGRVHKVSKKDPKTRHQRPQEEWTAADVASEFAYRVYDKVRGIPGMVNTKDLRIALSMNRKKFGTTALIEMEVMDKFFADERSLLLLKKLPKKSHGIFLNAITANAQEVIDRYDMDEQVDEPRHEEYVYASDGKKFDNSVFGRISLEKYEANIKRA